MLLDKKYALDFTAFSEIHIQKSLFSSAFHHQLPVAAWRLPHQVQQHVIIDLSGAAKSVPLELESLAPGFVMSPFINATYPLQAPYIRADVYYCSGQAEARTLTRADKAHVVSAAQFLETTHRCLQRGPGAEANRYHLPAAPAACTSTSKADFLATVAQAVQTIEAGHLQKVVPSRRKTVALPDYFDVVEVFHKLCEAYPAAFVSVFSVPGVGTWVGASPEILVSTFLEEQTKKFRTVSLAGTQTKKEHQLLRDVAWRQKEIEEQALVSRYIVSCFKKIRLREFEEQGPKTVAAGNLIHLRTDFTVDIIRTNFPELASTMLELLHPTSAVCGMPKAPALAFLRQHEGYAREYFSGFIGPVNVLPEELHLFVNLRCMQLLGQRAVLYSGAGVTVDSDPAKEWAETEAKMNTLLKVMFG